MLESRGETVGYGVVELAKASAATHVWEVMMQSSGTSTRTSPGEMSRVATHPRPVRGNFPMVTPCSSTPRRRIQSRYARSVAVCSGLGRCSSGAAAFPREVSAGGFLVLRGFAGPSGGGGRLALLLRHRDSPTTRRGRRTSSRNVEATRARVLARREPACLLGHAQDRKGKRAGYFTTRWTAFAFSRRSLDNRRAARRFLSVR